MAKSNNFIHDVPSAGFVHSRYSEWKKMDRLDDEDIGIIWERRYPKRVERASSMSLCLTRAKRITNPRAGSYSLTLDKIQEIE